MNFRSFKAALLTVIFCTIMDISLVSAQVDMGGMTKPELVRMQIESMMIKDTMMITQGYHKEVEIFAFPDKILASGLDKAKNYWIAKAMSDKETHLELVDTKVVGDVLVATLNKMDLSKDEQYPVYYLYHFENNKIRRIYFVEP